MTTNLYPIQSINFSATSSDILITGAQMSDADRLAGHFAPGSQIISLDDGFTYQLLQLPASTSSNWKNLSTFSWGAITGTLSDQTDLEAALAALELPSQSGQSGKFLKTNGTSASWASVSGGGSSWGSITGTLSDQTDLEAVLAALELPDQTGQSGNFLTTDGTNASWASVDGGSLPFTLGVYDVLAQDASNNALIGTDNNNYPYLYAGSTGGAYVFDGSGNPELYGIGNGNISFDGDGNNLQLQGDGGTTSMDSGRIYTDGDGSLSVDSLFGTGGDLTIDASAGGGYGANLNLLSEASIILGADQTYVYNSWSPSTMVMCLGSTNRLFDYSGVLSIDMDNRWLCDGDEQILGWGGEGLTLGTPIIGSPSTGVIPTTYDQAILCNIGGSPYWIPIYAGSPT